MQAIQLTTSHWIFLGVFLSIFVFIACRKGVIVPSVIGIFLLGVASNLSGTGILNKTIFGVQVIFNALLGAGVQLFPIMLVISLMVAMLLSLQAQGADRIMIAPMKKLMIGPWSAFFVLATAMYAAAVFFWPTPSVALVGTVLIPVAIRVGLPAIGAAVAVNLAGHGMALSADPVIQGAIKLTSTASNIDPAIIFPYTILFSLTVGAVAVSIACYTLRRDMRAGKLANGATDGDPEPEAELEIEEKTGKYAHLFAVLVPVLLLSVASLMIYRGLFDPHHAIKGKDATALLGGTATFLLICSSFAHQGHHALDGIAEHLRGGFYFAVRIFAPIIPIVGFFLLGNAEQASAVIGPGTPGFLFDFGAYIGAHLDGNIALISFGMSSVAVLVGMDGSGFAGLPLVGSLAVALGGGVVLKSAILAALGQVTTIWVGGGTLCAWAFGACADAGIAGVSPTELVRRNFVPVISGIVTITIIAIILTINL